MVDGRSRVGARRPAVAEDVRGGDVLLAIEIASSTLVQDRGPKARLYAGYHVHELWVVDTNTRTTWIHRNAAAGQWQEIVEVPPSEALRFDTIPAFAIRLDQFS